MSVLPDSDLESLKTRLAALGRPHTASDVAGALALEGHLVSDEVVLATQERLRRDSVGAGPLEPLLQMPGVTDVLVNGTEAVYVDRGSGLERVAVAFESEDHVRRLAARLAASVGRRLDDGSPYVDARLTDGTRVHAVLGSLAHPGTCISLRVPAARRFRLEDWVRVGSLSAPGAGVLARIIDKKVSFLVSGGTGTGKTTLLASLLGLVPARERLLIVEDSLELNPDHPHVVRLEARHANAEGAGAVTLTDLVRQALRMRPDRIVLGEVRGPEICDLLLALNTGHEGGCCTVHANSAADVPVRMEALAALGGLPREAAHAQLASAVRVAIHIVREASGLRRVSEVCVLERGADGLVRARPALHLHPWGTERGDGAGLLEDLLA